MTVTGRLQLIAVHAPDIERLASVYAGLARLEDRPQGTQLGHAADGGRPDQPAIRQQTSPTSPQPAPCRFNAIRLLTIADVLQWVGTH
jgi:hypothetical protein